MAIVRDQNDGYNLALGEPFFLSDVMGWTHNIEVVGPYYYPLFSGDKVLLEELQLLYPGKHIVVMNGAKQAIAATLYAMKELEGYTSAYFPSPYWLSYPTMVKLAGLSRELESNSKAKTIKIDTMLNNPDGRIAAEAVDILDCAYSHSVYGLEQELVPHRVSIWSAAKLYGLSGLRIGWAVFEDPKLAQKAAFFTEITTSGVSNISQQHMAKVLKYTRQNNRFVKSLYNDARQLLIHNAELFNECIAPHCDVVKGASTEHRGMFAYFKVNDINNFEAALKKSRVLVVNGKACGETEPGWYRMSLGHRNEFVQQAIGVLASCMKK